MSGFQPHAEGLVVKAAAHDEDFLGIFVTLAAKRGCVGTGMESRQPSVLASLFVDAQSQFLGDAFEALDRLPPVT